MTTSRRRCPRSPLENDDLLSEILLRLSPQPSSLPRASAVCKRWCHLVSDPAFLHRFRIHHCHNPPLLGFFNNGSFQPTSEAPNCIPPERFSLQFDYGDRISSLGCRHGLVLVLHISRKHVLVWDPVTGDQHRIAFPPGFDPGKTPIHGAVLSPTGDGRYFQVVLVAGVQHRRVLACVYFSETGAWGDIISTTLPVEDPATNPRILFFQKPAALVGDSLCFCLRAGNVVGILEFDLERQSLALIQVPMDMFGKEHRDFWVVTADGGGLGFLFVSEPGFSLQFWKRKTDVTDCDGVASWGLGRTIEMDKLLPLCKEKKGFLTILGFAEENNVVFIWSLDN